jgi:two-component system CheB/CheR fusion protein
MKISENNNSKKIKQKTESSENYFPIVGIGVSAGGLEALEQFFENMPHDNGMAFIVIQHLDPDHPSMMPELLQRITPMKVYQATDRLIVKPDHVYVIPPNKSMSILNGILHLFQPIETRGLRLPIDYFFRSLAIDQKDKSIGIILSGMGTDGSLGFKAIKESNGLLLVQEPSDAKFEAMPRSAINAVQVDVIAKASELPRKLIEFIKHIPLSKSGSNSAIKDTSNLEKIVILLRAQTGHDFSLYKKNHAQPKKKNLAQLKQKLQIRSNFLDRA